MGMLEGGRWDVLPYMTMGEVQEGKERPCCHIVPEIKCKEGEEGLCYQLDVGNRRNTC